jgi:hypothetical protein
MSLQYHIISGYLSTTLMARDMQLDSVTEHKKNWRKEDLVMQERFKGKAGRWLVVFGLLLVMTVTSIGFVQAASLSDDEVYWLTYMREEEKLARDVYATLYATWGKRIFNNIRASEQMHMDAIKTLLVRYGVVDPVTDDAVGKFTEKFQTLYNELILAGSVSLIDALKVGMFIEETDIDDLEKALALTTHRDIKKVYTDLMNGSYNHLAAFCSNMAKLGEACEAYTPSIDALGTQLPGPGPAPNSGDGVSDGSGWDVPPKGFK